MNKILKFKNIVSIITLIVFSFTINSCGIYRKTDARKIPTNADERIKQMKNDAFKDIKNTSVKIAIESVKKLLKNSLDKSKLDKIYLSSVEETKLALKKKSS